jgi:hypothetical protein
MPSNYFFSPFHRNADERRNQNLAVQVGKELVENIDSAKYYMSLGIYEWNGPLALSNLNATGGVGNIPQPISGAISFASLAIESFLDSFRLQGFNLSTDASLTQIIKYKLPITERLSDSQNQRWEEKPILGGNLISAIGSSISQRASSSVPAAIATVAGAAISDVANFSSIVTGLSINEFIAIKYTGPSFKTYSITWTLSPNTPEIARNIKDFLRTVNKFVAPKKISLLWDYPKIFKLELNKNNTVNPNMYKFKPAVCTSINVNYSGSDIPTFLPDGQPETVRITMQFKELVYWSREDYNENW